MTNAKEKLIAELISQLNDDEQIMCRKIIACLTELGYVPYKESVRDFVLSFKNREVRQTITKIGIKSGREKGVFYRIKFYACESPPLKFLDAVINTVIQSNGQYGCSDCGVCGATEGKRGYRCQLPNGTEFLRCGAYVVEIPNLAPEDITDFNALLNEQHAYFSTRVKRALYVTNEN